MEVTRLSVDRHFSCSGGGTSLTLTRRNRVTHWLMWLWLKISLGFGDATFSDEAIWDGHCRYKICCLPEWNMTMEHSPHIEWFFFWHQNTMYAGFFHVWLRWREQTWLVVVYPRHVRCKPGTLWGFGGPGDCLHGQGSQKGLSKTGGLISDSRLWLGIPNFIPPKKKGLGVALGLPQYRRY